MVTSNATEVTPRIMCLAVSLLAIAALALTTQPAQADKQGPFRAAFATEFESVVMPPIGHISVIGVGSFTVAGTISSGGSLK